jgi:hypothetical protein
VQIARDAGALAVLPLALNYLATLRTFEGNLQAAAVLSDDRGCDRHRAHRVRKIAAHRVGWRRGASISADRGH